MKKIFKKYKADVIRWKQFSRKGDAIFRSLGREIVILTLSVTTLTFATPDTAQAQTVANPDNDYLEEDTLETVVVTATQIPLPMEQTARIVSVITYEQLQCCPAQSVNDILKTIASVDVRQRSAFGIQTDISINGGTHDQILILVDGVNISSPHTGHLTADFPLVKDDIERIEILEGASSRVYGTNAFSGAINIITKKQTRDIKDDNKFWIGNLGIDLGSFGTLGVEGTLSNRCEHAYNSISTSFKRSDGAVSNSQFDKTTLFYHGGLQQSNLDMNWHLGATIQNFGANTFYSGKYPNQYEQTQKYQGALSLKTKGVVAIKPTIYWTKAFDHYQLVKHSDFGENFHSTDVLGISLNSSTNWKLGTSLFCTDIRNEGIYSTSLGKPLDEINYVKIPGSNGFYTKKDNRTNVSFFLEHDVVLDRWTFSLGMMANMNTAFDNKYRFYPGIDVSFRPSNDLRLFASWNMAQRMPTFTDLYYKSPTQEGNVGLRPEETNEWALASNYRINGLKAGLRLFYRHDKSMIDWIMTPDDSENGFTTYHATNFKLNKFGVNFNALFLFGELFESPMIDRFRVNYTYLYQKRHDNLIVVASCYALDYLRHKMSLSLDSRKWRHLTANFSFRLQNRKGGFLEYIPNINDEDVVDYLTSFHKYNTFGILSVKLRWSDDKYELYLEGENITNVKYYDIGNVRQPGFCFMTGLKWNF